MNVLGTYRVSWEAVRRLAIECHALDSTAHRLLIDTTLDDTVGKNRVAYEELVTEKLLALAIALRMKFYQGADPAETASYANGCGLLDRIDGVKEEEVSFTFKDVCDKIIHADNIVWSIATASDAEWTDLFGAEQRGGKSVLWHLGLSVTLFAQSVLNWIATKEA